MTCKEEKHDISVCQIVKQIEKAQAMKSNDDCNACSLIKPVQNNLDTVPVMLICRGDCGYFIAKGIFKDLSTNSLECFETPLFRVVNVSKEDGCTATLELLQAQTEEGLPIFSNEGGVCGSFPVGSIKKIIRTGICITIDLSCFCGMECLPAVRAEQGNPVPAPIHHKIFKEELCGNFGPGTMIVWAAALPGEIVNGTFQVFNSAASTSNVHALVSGNPSVTFPPIPPGFTISREVLEPTSFTINSPQGASGTYCIKLFKQVRQQ